MELSFLKRASLTRHLLAQKLFKIIEDKRSNLALALDVRSQHDLLKKADELGPYIAVLKTHVDILDDYTSDFGEKLRRIADRHQFLIFEDRKFADIGQTASLQYSGGIYRISEWADLINAHIISGPGIIEGLKSVAPKGSGLLLLAQMSSSGTLAKGSYTKKAVEFAEQYSDYVCGFICLKRLTSLPGMIHFTPGVKLQKGKDSLGQQYRTVEDILIKNKSDMIIVGRDITHASDPKKQAALYQSQAWSIYKKNHI